MDISLTTRWNASRHSDGRAMVDEILELGFTAVELGYDTRRDLVEGVKARQAEGAVHIYTVHNFCPVPMGVSKGHPELFTFGDFDRDVRDLAVKHTRATIEFAAEIGAKVVVSHSGNVKMTRRTKTLKEMARTGQKGSKRYQKEAMKLMDDRDKLGRKQIPFVEQCLEQLLPDLERHGVAIALENLPTWEALPTEVEMLKLCRKFDHPQIRYWHDMGHGQIRENLGLINHHRWLENLEPYLAGMHVHDCIRPDRDHTMPPLGHMDFSRYKDFGSRTDIPRVIEPTTKTPASEVRGALEFLKECWATESEHPSPNSPSPSNA